LYELDDLIHLADYPDSYETYDPKTPYNLYHQIMVTAPRYLALLKHCHFAIGSTVPMLDELAPYTISGKGFVHRNGLDSKILNLTPAKDRHQSKDEPIKVFYGSGTLAHNQDFIDLVLPALIKLWDRGLNFQLVLVGHLELPDAVVKKYRKNLSIIPKLDNLRSYYRTLEKADINLAVLIEDKLTNCKSELKWFEAGYFGIPSIVSSTQNYRDVVEDGIDCLVATSPEDWERHLTNLIENSDVRSNIGKACKMRVKKEYDPEYMGKQFMINLNEVIDQFYHLSPSK
jgi:glycosyltransferase involved in cell wall biosynthesis